MIGDKGESVATALIAGKRDDGVEEENDENAITPPSLTIKRGLFRRLSDMRYVTKKELAFRDTRWLRKASH